MNYTGFLLCYTFYGFPAMLYRNSTDIANASAFKKTTLQRYFSINNNSTCSLQYIPQWRHLRIMVGWGGVSLVSYQKKKSSFYNDTLYQFDCNWVHTQQIVISEYSRN